MTKLVQTIVEKVVRASQALRGVAAEAEDGLVCSIWRLSLVVGMVGVAGIASALETIRLADDRQVAAQGQTEFHFDLAEIPVGKQVRLCLDGRIEWGSLGGSTGALIMTVNGKGLKGRHLINKPLKFVMRNDQDLAWTSEDGYGYRLMYSPDFSDKLKTDETYEHGIPNTDPYHFVWDITSYVQVGANSVTVAAPQSMSFSLRLRDVAVEIGDPLPPLSETVKPTQETVTPGPNDLLREYVPKPLVEIPAAIGVSTDGSIRFRVGERDFSVRSRTSLPKGKWSGESRSEGVWSSLRRGRSFTSRWSETDYAIERQVTLHSDRISVADTIRNTSNMLIGLILEARLQLPEKPIRTLLAGHVPKRLKQRSSAAHPTAISEFEGLTIGLVAEDDIFRVHARMLVEDDTLVLSDPRLGIPPGKEHKLEWSIYAVPDGDYWDMINAIRRNWGSNVALRGPSKWLHPSGIPGRADQAKLWLQEASMVVLCNPIFGTEEERKQRISIQHGTALSLCQGWCEQAASAVRVLKEADPSVEAFVYTHQNLCTEPGHEKKYQDSRALDDRGKRATTVYVASPSLLLPTLEDSYGKALMAVQRNIVERLDANIYIDEITASNVPAFGAYDDMWDGCTVAIDPRSHAVTGKLSSAILLMQPWRAALMEYLKAKGKTVIANGPHYTRTMLDWPVQCFVESGPGDNIITGAHLSHPLCLVHYSGPPTQARYNAARQLLDRAGILFVPFAADAPVFPITPIELHAGVVIGEERILTNRSGRFGWGDDSSADLFVFDGEGQRVASPNAREVRQGGTVMVELRLPADHMAILVRRR